MFDMLTHHELSVLHHILCLEHTAVTEKMMGPGISVFAPGRQDGRLVFTPEWALLRAKASEIYETVGAVHAEIIRREQEASADA